MRWIGIVAVALIVLACGGAPSTPARRVGPDVVTAEWSAGDDAVLDGE